MSTHQHPLPGGFHHQHPKLRLQSQMLSRNSTVISINSPAVETASLASDMTLVDRSNSISPVTKPTIYGGLPPAPESYEELAPQPLKQARFFSLGAAPTELQMPVDKPLPALPTCEDHPAWRGESGGSILTSSKPEKTAARPSRRQTMPEKPKLEDLDALNEAFARKGLALDLHEDSGIFPIYLDVREVKIKSHGRTPGSPADAAQVPASVYPKEMASVEKSNSKKSSSRTVASETVSAKRTSSKKSPSKTAHTKSTRSRKESPTKSFTPEKPSKSSSKTESPSKDPAAGYSKTVSPVEGSPKTDSQKPNRARFSLSSPKKNESKRQAVGLLTRVVQSFWPSKILGDRRQSQPPSTPEALREPSPASEPEPTPSTPAIVPEHPPHPAISEGPIAHLRRPSRRLARSAGKAPPNPVARMKRVLSVLMDERFSMNLNTLSCIGEVDVLLQRTRVLLAHNLQPVRSRIQEVEGCSPAIEKQSVKLIGSVSEVDGSSQDLTQKRSLSPSLFRRIMQEVDDLPDLFALALVNKASYTVFKTDELRLIKGTLKKISPPAWELRQIKEVHWDTNTPGAQSLAAGLYLRHYTWDLMHLTNMKFLLQDHCEPLLSKDLVIGLRNPYDTRAQRVDAAIWRVWTFCHLFGNRKDRENDLEGQRRWLRGQRTDRRLPQVCRFSPDPADFNTVLFSPPEGFAQGNPASGLTKSQLLDMVDIWIGLRSLLDFLRKHTRLARKNGVFENAEVPPQTLKEESRMLRAWLDFILTLGPQAVLELAPAGPNSSPEVAFSRAKLNGWTQWTPPSPKAPRSNFLITIARSILQKLPDDEPEPVPTLSNEGQQVCPRGPCRADAHKTCSVCDFEGNIIDNYL